MRIISRAGITGQDDAQELRNIATGLRRLYLCPEGGDFDELLAAIGEVGEVATWQRKPPPKRGL